MSEVKAAVMDPESTSYRLPRNVVPEKYEIKLEPDLRAFTFLGEETIHITVAEPVRQILLNAVDLEIHSISAANIQGTTLKGSVSLDNDNERAVLDFDETLQAGTWRLTLKFKGELNDKLHGFYRSTYKDATGETKVIASTQFEATDARRAFPCFDEPDFKATFRITLIVDRFLTAISNTQVKKEQILSPSNKKAVFFKESIKMSTYLVAFVVGEFEGTETKVVDDTPVRVYTRPGQLHLARFAEAAAAHSLSYFNGYYGLKYPGDKLDLIAIPDFAFGAMENLGCVTFRDNALLVDEKTASHAELERVADVVAHEIAHMWFGDLATMKWWNGIWLNEAFATFMEMLAVDTFKPSWKRWDTFGVSRAQAFSTDGLKSTRTIEFPVKKPEEAQGMFDVLTYEKGAAVLRMLEQYLGPEHFRRGISLYLSKHKYANAETTDLWDAIEEATHQPVRQMMDSWIFQAGHPLISAEIVNDGKSLRITQQRFLYERGDDETLFHVPVMLKARTKQELVRKKLLLKEREQTIDLGETMEWCIVNEGGHGFYRVNYSKDLVKKLTDNLNQLSAIERFNLLNDTWALVLSGIKPLREYLDLILLFKEERDKNVWAVILASLAYLEKASKQTDSPKTPESLSQLTRTLLGKLHQKLGWTAKEHEDELTRLLRGMVIGALGTLGEDREVQEQAAALFEKYQKDRSAVSPDIAPALVTIVAHTGSDTTYNEFDQSFKKAATPQEEDRFMYALAAFRDTKLLERTLEKTINGEVRTQNAPYLVRSVMQNTKGRELAWQFVKKNWHEMMNRFPAVTVTRMCEGCIALVDDEMLADVRQFFQENQVKQGRKTVDQHLEKLSVACAFKGREAGELENLAT